MEEKQMFEKRMQEINARKLEIRGLLESGETVDLNAIQTELNSLEAEAKDLETRAEVAKGINAGTIPANVIEKPVREERNMENLNVASVEYRNQFYTNMIETRSSIVATGAIPTQTLNQVITKVKEYCPMLSKVNLFTVEGSLTVNVEGDNADASLVAAGATLTESDDTLVPVTLGNYNVAKMVRVPVQMLKMGVDAIEAYVVDNLSQAIANKINAYLLTGTGSSQPTGIEKAQTWVDGTNMVEIAAASDWTYDEVLELIGLAKAGKNEFYMSRKTLFAKLMGLTDSEGNKLVTGANDKFAVLGYSVNFDERIADSTMYFGDIFKAVVANISIPANVTTAYDIDTNCIKYRSDATFDSKIVNGTSIVKGYKKSA
jgi:HK97 family phage major capsid protein